MAARDKRVSSSALPAWKLEDAKAQFSEVVPPCSGSRPQRVPCMGRMGTSIQSVVLRVWGRPKDVSLAARLGDASVSQHQGPAAVRRTVPLRRWRSSMMERHLPRTSSACA